MQPKAAFIVSVARGLVVSGALMMALPPLLGADSQWLAMPITELAVEVYAAVLLRKYTAALPENRPAHGEGTAGMQLQSASADMGR